MGVRADGSAVGGASGVQVLGEAYPDTQHDTQHTQQHRAAVCGRLEGPWSEVPRPGLPASAKRCDPITRSLHLLSRIHKGQSSWAVGGVRSTLSNGLLLVVRGCCVGASARRRGEGGGGLLMWQCRRGVAGRASTMTGTSSHSWGRRAVCCVRPSRRASPSASWYITTPLPHGLDETRRHEMRGPQLDHAPGILRDY